MELGRPEQTHDDIATGKDQVAPPKTAANEELHQDLHVLWLQKYLRRAHTAFSGCANRRRHR